MENFGTASHITNPLKYTDQFFLKHMGVESFKLRKMYLKNKRWIFFQLPRSCFLTEYSASVSLKFQLTVFFRLILYLQETALPLGSSHTCDLLNYCDGVDDCVNHFFVLQLQSFINHNCECAHLV